MATLLEIAQAANVSKTTVSRALRCDPTLSITSETRAKILDAAKNLGYTVKEERRIHKNRTIAVIHKDDHFETRWNNSFYFSMRYGIEQVCFENNIRCLFYPIRYMEQVPKDVDGAVMMGNFSPENQKRIRDFFKKSVPMVFLGRVCFDPDRMDWVTYDVEQGVQLAVERLIQAGRTQILYLGGINLQGPDEHTHKLLYFNHTLQKHPEVACIGVVEGEHGSDSGYELMKTWLDEHTENRPDGIFVTNDPIAFGALRALAEHGISVPGQISVVALNGDEPGANTIPPLTSVNVYTEEMGKEAVRCLLERWKGLRAVSKKIQYNPTLIERKSV